MALLKDLDDTQAPLIEHLLELRTRLVRAVLALLVAFGGCLFVAEDIFGILVRPLTDAFPEGEGTLIYTKLYEAFFVNIKVALFAGFFLSFPIIANQLWGFVAPGLYAKEKRAFLPFLIATPVLFIAGASLAYFVVMPNAFKFFLGFEGEIADLPIEALPAAGDYLSLVMQFILAFGISFLLPVLMMLLSRAGIVTREQFKKSRRFVVVGIIIFAAIVTPPDWGSQIVLALPLMLLFEGSLILMLITEKRAAKARAKSEAEEAAVAAAKAANASAVADSEA